MKKIEIKNLTTLINSNKKIRNFFIIDLIFFFHITIGFFLISFLAMKFSLGYEKAAITWIIIFLPIFFIKIYKDSKQKDL